jgi:isoquinoline 1-oxidoreductase beta subunit
VKARVGDPDPSRRSVLAAGGFTLAFLVSSRPGKALALGSPRPQPEDAAAAAADGHPAFAPNAFIRIDRSGPVRMVMPNVEMGQGAYTGQATIMAEELDIGLDQLVVEHAPPNAPLYAMPGLKMQATGGSATIRGGWHVFREAGGVARAMLVAAAAQRWGVSATDCTTDRGVVRHPPSGRQATYQALARRASRQPVPTTVALKDPKDFKLIGKSSRRLDTAAKVDGSLHFGIDVSVPDMMVAAVAACPVYGGTVKSVDERRARSVAGVRDVIKLDNAVAVTGVHYWAAKCGLEALDVEWDLGPNADLDSDALTRAMARASREGAAIVAREVGDIGLGGTRIEAIYQFPALAHAPMEPLNAVVHVRPDACEIWVGTQVPIRVVDAAVRVTGLPADKIILHNQYLGGGFGRRLEEDSVEQAVAFARQVAYPVKVIWSRELDIQQDSPRPPYYDRIAAVVDADGYPRVWTDRVTSDSVARRWAPALLRKDGLDKDTVAGAEEPPYHLPNLKVEWVSHPMPGGRPVGWWRGVGSTHNLFKVESFIDELAHAAGKDPVAYRRALLSHEARTLGVLDLAAEKFGWGPAQGERVGHGVAVGEAFGSYICVMLEAEVAAGGDVRLRRAVAAVDCGLVINPNTVEAQVQGGLVFGWTGALYSGLTYRKGAIEQSNFHDYRMMRINETPPIAVHIVPSAERPGGIGEVGTVLAAPALGNAIFAATGVRLRALPIDRDLLVKAKSAKPTAPGWLLPVTAAAAGLTPADEAAAESGESAAGPDGPDDARGGPQRPGGRCGLGGRGEP